MSGKQNAHYDLCVIGGGINGAGIARDAAGRGMKTIMVEARDLANATSSASTKLVHGGLRYLEYYEFGLVRHALVEREKLLSMAPHIIWPLEFILPHNETLRPYWLIRLGLFLYDLMAGRKTLPSSKGVRFSKNTPLKASYKKGLSYADCWVEDSRLVVLNAMDATALGADVLTRTSVTNIKSQNRRWHITLSNGDLITADKIANAAGPWVFDVLEKSGLVKNDTPHIRLVKGSHIIISRHYEGDQAYILQQPDGRIVFTIPYEHKYTLVGTTDEPFEGDAYDAAISDAETDYLIGAVNSSFQNQISRHDIIKTYSGVRPLLDDGHENESSVTRDYKLVSDTYDGAEILSVFGGKITTYRILAQQAVDALSQNKTHWTDKKPLPGGDFGNFEAFLSAQKQKYKGINDALIYRYARAYGTMMDDILKNGLGAHYGDGLYECEVRHLIQNEFAVSAEDILWRRSKLDLHTTKKTKEALNKALEGIKREGKAA